MISAHGVLGGGSLTPVEIVIIAIGGLVAVVGGYFVLRLGGQEKSAKGKLGFWLLGGGLLLAMLGPAVVPESSGAACTRPQTKAAVRIISPKAGEKLQGGKVPVEVELTGGKLASLASTKNAPDRGHLHLSLDGQLLSMTGESRQTIDAAAGEHLLVAEFVANDHAPFCKRVTDRVRFVMDQGAAGRSG